MLHRGVQSNGRLRFEIDLDRFPDKKRERLVINRWVEAISGVESFTIVPHERKGKLVLPLFTQHAEAETICRQMIEILLEKQCLDRRPGLSLPLF